MESLQSLLSAIPTCHACGLMAENNSLGIRFVPVVPKPSARVIFVGRDPSPRTAQSVGLRGGPSVFIREIFEIVDEAGISDDLIYITDLCKCHWRTSVGKPLHHTEHRSSNLDPTIADTCMSQWLIPEIRVIQPLLIVAFGEELYQLLRRNITHPSPAPLKLSASKDKSIPDAEAWFVENGPLLVELDSYDYSLVPIRHPGNSSRLPKSSPTGDRRYEYYRLARAQLIEFVSKVCT